VLAQWPWLPEEEQAAAAVSAKVVQVGVHGVGASAEVYVVRKVEPVFILVYLRNLELKLEVAAQRVELSVALLHFLQRLLELSLVVRLAGGELG